MERERNATAKIRAESRRGATLASRRARFPGSRRTSGSKMRATLPSAKTPVPRWPDRCVRVPTSQILAISLMLGAPCRRILASMSETSWIDPDMDAVMSELPTGTVTLLLADVESSTRLWETQPDAMKAAFERLDQTLSDAIASHRGVRPVEQGEGDSFVIAFARAADAVACALDLQRAPLAPIKLRIGLHTGDIQLRDEGNYIGPTINRTARLRDLAHGGQTVLSGATEPLVVDQLPEDVTLTDLGSHPLRDLPRPERVVQLCHPDLHNDFPPLRTANAVAAERLPAQLTSFIGRQSEIKGIRDAGRQPPGHADGSGRRGQDAFGGAGSRHPGQ